MTQIEAGARVRATDQYLDGDWKAEWGPTLEGTVMAVGIGNMTSGVEAMDAGNPDLQDFITKYPYEVQWDGVPYNMFFQRNPLTGVTVYDRVGEDELEAIS